MTESKRHLPVRFATFEIVVPSAYEDDASVVLWEQATVGVQVETRPGDLVALTASFPDDPAIAAALGAALADVPGATVRALALPDVDWVARFREDFRAFDASGFTIAPEWDGRRPDRDTIVVDPGRAFGTGTHETTRLCLAFLTDEAERRAIPRVIDVGAGTGILAVAAPPTRRARRGRDRLRPGSDGVLRAARAPQRGGRCTSWRRTAAGPSARARSTSSSRT